MKKPLLLLAILLAGCQSAPPPYTVCPCRCGPAHPLGVAPPPVVIAKFTSEAMLLDGKLNEGFWQRAAAYPLSLAKNETQTKTLQEGGEVRYAWDQDNFYVGIKFSDSDILDQAAELAPTSRDREHHYRYGDVCEFFIRPENRPHYWELYATPRGELNRFWFWMRGGELNTDRQLDLQVASHLAGTINNPADRDAYWTAELKIPIHGLERFCDPFAPGFPWRVLLARYNYATPLEEGHPREYSSSPQLDMVNFHRQENYAILKLER